MLPSTGGSNDREGDTPGDGEMRGEVLRGRVVEYRNKRLTRQLSFLLSVSERLPTDNAAVTVMCMCGPFTLYTAVFFTASPP